MKKTIFFLCSVFAFAQLDIISKDFERIDPSTNNKILSYSHVIKSVRKSVVSISTQKTSKKMQANPFLNDPFFRQFFDHFNHGVPQERVERALGSGVIVSSDGYIVTNNHVVENAQKVIVSLQGDKKEYTAKIIGLDPKSDLAVIKIKAKNLNPIKMYDSDKLEVGDLVFAIGNPFGVGETITSGIVSAKNRNSIGINEYEDFIQTDAPINPGNSGGALVNSMGYLVGINSAILTRSGGSNGVGFSIPSNMVARVANSLIKHGSFKRAWLGVTIGALTDELSKFCGKSYGTIITNVGKNSPAQKAGLKRGDLILEVDGKRVENPNKLRNLIANKAAKTRVKITILRNKKEKTVVVELENMRSSRSSSSTIDYKGLQLSNINDNMRKKYRLARDLEGVVIVGSDKGSRLPLRQGDVIVQVGQKEIKNLKTFKKATKGNGKKEFFIYRSGHTFVIVF